MSHPLGERAVVLGGRRFVLRAFRPEDMAPLEGLLGDAPVGATMTESLTQVLAGEDASKSAVLVAEADGAPAGTATLVFSGENAWLYTVAVRPDLRGLGLGAAMVARMIEFARERGAKRLRAHVRANNPAARRAYEKAGMANAGADGMRGEQLRYEIELA